MKAMAGKQGFSLYFGIESLWDETSERKLQVPAFTRGTLFDIGLGEAIALLNVREVAAADGMTSGLRWR